MRYRGIFVFCIVFLALATPAFVDALPIVGEKDICLSESIVVERGKPPIVRQGSRTSDQYKSCKLGIGGIENCGKVSFTGPATRDNPTGRPCEAVSKCSRDYKKRLNSCMLALGLESTDEIDLSDPAAVRQQVEGLDLDSSRDQQILAETLREMGIPSVTSAHVNENPEVARDLALKILDGDEEGARAAARELGLNDDLRDVKYLRPADDGEEDHPDVPDDWKYTGGVTLDAAPVGTSADEEKWKTYSYGIAKLESGGNYRATTCTYKGCALGKYQVMDFNLRSWTQQALSYSMSREQFLNDPDAQEKVFRHVFGQYLQRTGGDDVKAAMMWFGGPGALNKLNARDPLGTSVWSYGQRYAAITGGKVPDSYGYMGRMGSLTGGISPFASTNPFVSSSAGGGASASAQPSYAQQAPAQQYPQQQPPRPPVPVSSQILPPGTQTGVSGSLPPAPAQPEASIIVQPKEVVWGNPLVVSWSTVGMSAANACQIYLQVGGTTSLFVRGNEGSRTFTTSATSTPGTWEFRLQCSSPTGAAFERNASVVVK